MFMACDGRQTGPVLSGKAQEVTLPRWTTSRTRRDGPRRTGTERCRASDAVIS